MIALAREARMAPEVRMAPEARMSADLVMGLAALNAEAASGEGAHGPDLTRLLRAISLARTEGEKQSRTAHAFTQCP